MDDPETVHMLWSEELEEHTKRVLSGEVDEEDWGTVHVLAVARDRRRPGYWGSRVEP